MDTFGKYRIIEKIATGGMAEVYLATGSGEWGYDRLFAVKRLLPEYTDNPEFITMFRDEANIGKHLVHGNIVQVISFEIDRGQYGIVLEFVNGIDLHTLTALLQSSGNPLTVAMVCFIIRESARGLHFAHTRNDPVSEKPLNIIHRDISPSNIMISLNGDVKVSDFGIAKMTAKEGKTRAGILKGKFAYMSPEQIRGQNLTPSSDIFSLGTVMWEALTGKPLFVGTNEAETINRVAHALIDSKIGTLRPDVPEELSSLLLQMLGREILTRFPTAQTVEQVLTSYLNRHHSNFLPEQLAQHLAENLPTKIASNQERLRRASSAPQKAPMTPEPTMAIDLSSISSSANTVANPQPSKRIVLELPLPSNGSAEESFRLSLRTGSFPLNIARNRIFSSGSKVRPPVISTRIRSDSRQRSGFDWFALGSLILLIAAAIGFIGRAEIKKAAAKLPPYLNFKILLWKGTDQ